MAPTSEADPGTTADATPIAPAPAPAPDPASASASATGTATASAPASAPATSTLVGQGPADILVAASDPTATAAAYQPEPDNLGAYFSAWINKLRGGEIGVLPVIVGLILLVVIFQAENSTFLTAGNLTNLIGQGAQYMLLGMAEVFVLLLGDIDLSIGYLMGIGAAVTCILIGAPYSEPWWVACLAGMGATTALGTVQGLLVTLLGLPSFVVTLAGQLAFSGLLIVIINSANGSGVIPVNNNVINDLVNGNMSPLAGWIAMIAVVVLFGGFMLYRGQHRRHNGLHAQPLAVTVLKIVVMAGAGIAVVAVGNSNRGIAGLTRLRGVPWVTLIVLGVLGIYEFTLGRTRFGRYFYAIGGNAEAARRAGVNIRMIRTSAFALSGLTAGVAGIVLASRLGSISTDLDGGTEVLYAVAAAVIGGTSLFGGRGKMLYALLGGIVIATIYNGLGLLGLSAQDTYIVAALVLLVAVTVDAVARRNSVRR